MKKIVSLAIALLMVLSFASALAEPLVFSYWGGGLEKDVIEAALKSFTEETGIEVEGLHIPDEYLTKITAMAASDTLPDLGYMSEPIVVEWGMNDMFVDLTDLYASPDFPEKLETNTYRTPDGMPLGTSLANETIVMFYNKAIFDEAGLPYPPSKAEDAWTWDEFVEVAKKLTKDDAGLTPNDEGFNPQNTVTFGCRVGKAFHILHGLLNSNGGGIFSEDYKELTVNSPESIEVFQALQDLITVHHVHPAPDQNDTVPDASAAFLSNRLAMHFDGQWSLQSLAEAKKEDGIDFGIAVLPKFKEPVTSNTGCPVVVFKSSDKQEEALQLMEYLLDPENVLPMLNSGLWQPTEMAWYTDEALIEKWLVEDVHPEGYRDAVIDYSLNYQRANPFFKAPGTNKIEDILGPALDQMLAGHVTAQEAVDSVYDEMVKVWAEYQH